MCMKALQDRCVTKEGMISCLRKRNETLTNEQAQYKGAIHSLNEEVTTLKEKLKEEASLRVKAQEEKANVEKELMAFYEQVEMAKANAISEFKASKPFIDACTIYYGDGFNDCVKQVGSVYPDLDLSKVTMDDPLPTTPVGGKTIDKETDNSTHAEQGSKDDSVVLAQPVLERSVTPLIQSIEDPPPQDTENPSTQDAYNPPSKDDKNPHVQDVQNPLV